MALNSWVPLGPSSFTRHLVPPRCLPPPLWSTAQAPVTTNIHETANNNRRYPLPPPPPPIHLIVSLKIQGHFAGLGFLGWLGLGKHWMVSNFLLESVLGCSSTLTCAWHNNIAIVYDPYSLMLPNVEVNLLLLMCSTFLYFPCLFSIRVIDQITPSEGCPVAGELGTLRIF